MSKMNECMAIIQHAGHLNQLDVLLSGAASVEDFDAWEKEIRVVFDRVIESAKVWRDEADE